MQALGVMFGQSEAEKRAEQARQDAEDRLMAVHSLEKTDLAFHCDAEAERAIVFITRIRDLAAAQASRADRNFVATIALGALILFKGDLSVAQILHFLGKFFGIG